MQIEETNNAYAKKVPQQTPSNLKSVLKNSKSRVSDAVTLAADGSQVGAPPPQKKTGGKGVQFRNV